MFENAITVEFQPGKVDEAMRILKSHVVPMLKDQAGLISLCLLPHPSQNTITVISLWDSKAHALAVEGASAHRREVQRLDALLANPPVYRVYEAGSRDRAYNWITLS
jgi:quinol monooxygenase YgiN